MLNLSQTGLFVVVLYSRSDLNNIIISSDFLDVKYKYNCAPR